MRTSLSISFTTTARPKAPEAALLKLPRTRERLIAPATPITSESSVAVKDRSPPVKVIVASLAKASTILLNLLQVTEPTPEKVFKLEPLAAPSCGSCCTLAPARPAATLIIRLFSSALRVTFLLVVTVAPLIKERVLCSTSLVLTAPANPTLVLCFWYSINEVAPEPVPKAVSFSL